MNIASNEEQSFDMTGTWVSSNLCRIAFRLNEDGMGDTEIDYSFDRHDLEFLHSVITGFLESQPKD